MRTKCWLLSIGAVLTGFIVVQLGCATTSMGAYPDFDALQRSRNFDAEGRTFINPIPTASGLKDWETTKGAIGRYFRNEQTPPATIEVATHAELDTVPVGDVRVTWVGHSTMLLEFDGFRVLTDPVWSERVSPFPTVGPRRFHAPGIAFDDLPKIDAVIISHDHYDHLDHETVERLAWRGTTFYVPLGIGSHLERWGIHDYHELDWWEEVRLRKQGRELRLVATPARHFSGRGVFDRDKTLWASWAVIGDTHRVYFGGDTGYFEGFREIGERLGPFDVTLMPIGAYDPAWADVHMNPEEAVQAHVDLGNHGTLLPIHYGTFALAAHGWSEPMDRLMAASDKVAGAVYVPRPGESLSVATDPGRDLAARGGAWWRALYASSK